MEIYFDSYLQNKSPEKYRQDAEEALGSLKMFFRIHEIYFDKKICEAISDYIRELQLLFVDFRVKQLVPKNNIQEWEKVWENINNNINMLKSDMEDSFRKKIGVE